MTMFRRSGPGVDFVTPLRRISGPVLCRKRGAKLTAHRKSPLLGLLGAFPSLGGILSQPFVLDKLPGKAATSFFQPSTPRCTARRRATTRLGLHDALFNDYQGLVFGQIVGEE